MEQHAYVRIPHTLITISGSAIETKKIKLAYTKFMTDGIEATATTIGQPTEGIDFHCLNEKHVKDGSIVVRVDGRIVATTSCSPCRIEKQLKYIKEKINEICRFLNITPYNLQTFITEGFRLDEIDIKNKPKKDEPKRRRASESYCRALAPPQNLVWRHDAQSPVGRFQTKCPPQSLEHFHIPMDHSVAPFQLKGVLSPKRSKSESPKRSKQVKSYKKYFCARTEPH